MGNYNVVIDLITHEVELKDPPFSGNNYLIYLLPAAPVIENQSFQVYESLPIGTSVGFIMSTDPYNITFSILSGNTGNAFNVNGTTGEITTSVILDYETLSSYSLGIKVQNNSFPSLTDTAIISIEVLKLYTKCSDSTIRFESSSTNLIGLLTVGNVIASSGTITDYAIEWRLNSVTGTTVLLTGSGSDPLLQALHPINSELVQAGTLYAVIRYIKIDGVLYSAYPFSSYGNYSPDLLTCLGHIDVISMRCNNGYTESTYQHVITYINTVQPSTVANRSLTFTLNEDGSTKKIAWKFYGYIIADRITILYCTTGGTETVLTDWVIGSDNTFTDYASTPKKYQSQLIQSVISLSGITYTSGDYLLFNVVPGYNAPGNTDTNWELSIKCFTTSSPMSCYFQPNDVNTIDVDSMSMAWNSGTCAYQLSYTTGNGSDTAYLNDFYKYYNYTIYTSWDWRPGQTISAAYNSGSTQIWVNNTFYGTPYLANGIIYIERSGGTLTYTFTSQNDYLAYRAGYTGMTSSSDWTNWSSDPTNVYHYKFIYDSARISMTSGDTGTSTTIVIDHDSVFTFDNALYKITINLATQTNGIISQQCNNTYSVINSWVPNINSFATGISFSYSTIWRTQIPFSAIAFVPYVSTPTIVESAIYATLPDGLLGTGCVLDPDWYLVGGYWYFYKSYLQLEITDATDPINHYKVYTKLKADGSLDTVWTLIKTVG